jgi:hypothetical protein
MQSNPTPAKRQMDDFMLFLTAVQGLSIRLEKRRAVLRELSSHETYFAGSNQEGKLAKRPANLSAA